MAPQTHDPIIAIATAPGRGGIGVVRLSGQDLEGIAKRLFSTTLIPRHAHYLPFNDSQGNAIDAGIVLYFKGPHSYTGEDVLELQGHGGPAVLRRVLDHCLKVGEPFGLRHAQPGEFTQRAFLNDVNEPTKKESNKHQHCQKTVPSQFPEIDGIGIKENHFHIE